MQTRNCARWIRSPLRLALAFLALLLVTPALFAHVIKLKDGSLVFARAPYTVKGTKAIITLENGTVTQIPLQQVDIPGTDKYNRENYGNAISIQTPPESAFRLPVSASGSRPKGVRLASTMESGQPVNAVLSGGPTTVRGSRRLP